MIKNYFKIALRNLKRNKSYAVINILGLALGLTCVLLVFSLVKYHLSFDNFHSNSDRIYRFVTEQERDVIEYQSSVPNPLGKFFRNDYTFGEKTARIATFTGELITVKSASGSDKFKETIAFTEPEYFQIFNFPLLTGDKNLLREPNTAVVTQKIALKYFGTQNAIGKVFRIDNRITVTITGILKNLPENTAQKAGLFVSFPTVKDYNDWFYNDNTWNGTSDAMQTFTLLRKGVDPAQVEKVLPAYVKKYRSNSKNLHHYKLQPLADIHFNAQYDGQMSKRNVWVLALIGIFLIVTACFNFINLASAQAFSRSKEVGVRKVLGGQKGQLFWQFISETGVITIAAAIIAIVLSAVLIPFINDAFKLHLPVNLLSDHWVALLVPVLIVLVTFFAGSYPALIMAGFNPVKALKGKLTKTNNGGFTTRRTLIVSQFVIAQVLIIGMIVILSQMRYAKQSDLGFSKDAIITIPAPSGSNPKSLMTFKNELKNIAGVAGVTACFATPASMNTWDTSVKYDRRPEEEAFRISHKAADADYLSVFNMKLIAGRNILPSDSVRELVVNETFVRKINAKSPEAVIGKSVLLGGGMMRAVIVGVVKDFFDKSMHEDINAVGITTYTKNYYAFAIKLNAANMRHTLQAIQSLYTKNYPDHLYEYQFLDDDIASFYETEETMLILIEAFSFIAIFIGCLGLYGLVSFMAAQKTKEIGIRKVLGGSLDHILWLFSKEFASLILISFLIASPIAWVVMNSWLRDFKYQITISPWMFLVSITLIMLIAAISVGYKSLKAAMANPIESLRAE